MPAMTALLFWLAALPCLGADQPNGAAIYQKHCAVCHPDSSKMNLEKPLADLLENPPPGMPAFRSDKLSARELDALAFYLPGRLPVAKRPDAQPKAKPAPEPAEKPAKPRENKSWMKGFGTSDL